MGGFRQGPRDLIDVAKDIGYYNVGYTTNCTTGRIFTNSDVISVSLDGPEAVHDRVRGDGVFGKVMKTLEGLEFSGSVYANMVLQKGNLEYIRETADIVRDNPRLGGSSSTSSHPRPTSSYRRPRRGARPSRRYAHSNPKDIPS